MKPYQVLLPLILIALLSMGFSQTMIPATQSSSYQLSSINNSGITGTVYLADYGMNTLLVVVNVRGADPNLSYPAHIHIGSCGSNGDVVIPLENVSGATALSITMTNAAYTDIAAGSYYVNVHRPEDMSNIVACAEVGMAAQATPSETGQTGLAQGSQLATGVKPEEFATQMRTEGYGIFAVNNSGISGQIQIVENAEGGADVIVTLSNIQRNQHYGLEIFQGDCGPDRPSLIKLEPVPSVVGDPNASETRTDLTYSDLAESNNFVYVYAPEGAVLACGEVGVGALSQ